MARPGSLALQVVLGPPAPVNSFPCSRSWQIPLQRSIFFNGIKTFF
jgi:hypothetical protein